MGINRIRLVMLVLCFFLIGILSFQSEAKTITVDDDWDGADHSDIQEAIDSAKVGDTIHLNSGLWDSSIIINKSINLRGNSTISTMIMPNKDYGNVIEISANNCSISNISIIPRLSSFYLNGGIQLDADNCTIENVSVSSMQYTGISIDGYNNTIHNNTIHSQDWGIHIENSEYNRIEHNNISCIYREAITMYSSSHTIIRYNSLRSGGSIDYYMTYGIRSEAFPHCRFTLVEFNNISDFDYGISLDGVNDSIIGNNFVNCGIGSFGTYTILTDNKVNGRPVVYWHNRDSGTLSGNFGQAILYFCRNVTVKDLEVNGGTTGLMLIECWNMTVKDSIANNNKINGFSIFNSYRCTISGNTANNNGIHGMQIFQLKLSSVHGNECKWNGQYGIYNMVDYGDVNFSNNDVKGNGLGGYLFPPRTESDNTDNTLIAVGIITSIAILVILVVLRDKRRKSLR